MDGRLLPDVRQAVHVVPLRPKSVPGGSGGRVLAVERKIRTRGRASVLRAPFRHSGDSVAWREIPEVTLGQVFARRGVRHAAGFIGLAHWQAASQPFGPDPVLERQFRAAFGRENGFTRVANRE